MGKIWLLVLLILYNGFSSSTGVTSNLPTRPSVVNIGAIFSFNSTIGKVAKVAIEAAVDDINSNSSVLNGTKLQISLLDTKLSSGFLGIVNCKFMCISIFILFFHLHFCNFTFFYIKFFTHLCSQSHPTEHTVCGPKMFLGLVNENK